MEGKQSGDIFVLISLGTDCAQQEFSHSLVHSAIFVVMPF